MRIGAFVSTAIIATLTAATAAAQSAQPQASSAPAGVTAAATATDPAQAPPAPAAAAVPAAPATEVAPPSTGFFDFGGRGTTFSGDSARYNQFRDLSNGLFLDDFQTNARRAGWVFDVDGNHAGRRDAVYTGEAVR